MDEPASPLPCVIPWGKVPPSPVGTFSRALQHRTLVRGCSVELRVPRTCRARSALCRAGCARSSKCSRSVTQGGSGLRHCSESPGSSQQVVSHCLLPPPCLQSRNWDPGGVMAVSRQAELQAAAAAALREAPGPAG